MKILAVIPARAGSKGIPNKNIRIVCGHPLIYYSIKNALDSKYITDVIISTDSPEVRIIATQMGTKYKWRDKSLCGDDVTLDSVIYDAVPKDEQWDYIVTMQPTSPTLKVETLDAAIKYTIDNDLETCISAVNAPHLSWRDENGQKVPNYEKRLNRQYLPANYLETGAFFISKGSIVTPQSRFGKKVGVYEVSENEAQDVDTFNDLRSVAATLSTPKVAIYVNGNNKRGIGHIYRALEMARGNFSTRATSLMEFFVAIEAYVMIWAQFSWPYLSITHFNTFPRPSSSKSVSISGSEIRSGFRKRSNSRSYFNGSIFVIPKQ